MVHLPRRIWKILMNPMATANPLRMTLLSNRENPQMTTLTACLPTIRREMMHRMRFPMSLRTDRKKKTRTIHPMGDRTRRQASDSGSS